MLSWIIQIIFISVLFIFLVHHLIIFLKNTLTTPKIKDLVTSSNKKYENIYNTINQSSTLQPIITFNDGSDIQSLPVLQPSMKDELKHFLKSQLSDDV
jgi:hypothetical protein